MIRPLSSPLLSAALAAAVVLSHAVAQAPAPVVGVVDIATAIEQYPVFIKQRKVLQEQAQLLEARQAQLQEQLDQMRASLMVVTDASEREGRRFEYDMEQRRAEHEMSMAGERLRLANTRMMLAAFEDLDYAVAEVARQKGLLLVFKRERIPLNPAPIAEQSDTDVQRRAGAYESRKVLWAAAEIDITDAVIGFMQKPLPSRNAPERAGPAPDRAAGGNGQGG